LRWGDQIEKMEGNDKENYMIDIRGIDKSEEIEIVPMAFPLFSQLASPSEPAAAPNISQPSTTQR